MPLGPVQCVGPLKEEPGGGGMVMGLGFLRLCLTAHFGEARLPLRGHGWTRCQIEGRFSPAQSLLFVACSLQKLEKALRSLLTVEDDVVETFRSKTHSGRHGLARGVWPGPVGQPPAPVCSALRPLPFARGRAGHSHTTPGPGVCVQAAPCPVLTSSHDRDFVNGVNGVDQKVEQSCQAVTLATFLGKC